MACDISDLITDAKCFLCLSEKAQQAIIAQLLCDISAGGGGGGNATSPFTVTSVVAPAIPYSFTATRRTRIEVSYQIQTGDDDTELRASKTGVPTVVVGKMFGGSGVSLRHIWYATFNLGPAETLTLTKIINATGDVDLLNVLIYEE